jgi:uncharacterized protein YqjF (DUF2071 family)
MKDMPFLSAEWSNLLVINYKIDPITLKPLLPRGTELDSFNGEYFISLVGFMFKKNKFAGLLPTFPYVNFEEANLRFYVKRYINEECRKGVAFIREVVPAKLIAFLARAIYNEPYLALPMSHEIQAQSVSYSWKSDFEVCSISAKIETLTQPLQQNTFPHFILEHYWGYTAQKNGSAIEYKVEHPPWNYHNVIALEISSSTAKFYGGRFEEVLQQKPHSAFVAQGSLITVGWPNRF